MVPHDDDLPARVPLPRSEGWFELFCCGTVVAVLILGLVILGLVH